MNDELRKECDVRGRSALRRLVSELPQTANGAGKQYVSPLTGAVTAELAQQSVVDLDRVFARAREVQKSWSQTSFKDRATLMLTFHDALLKERRSLLDLIQWETAKARKSAFEEVADVAINARYYAKNAENILADRRLRGAIPLLTKTTTVYKPKGVVAVISPWNYPLTLTASDALAAMMAGNAVVLKPDGQTPLTAFAVKALFETAGFPKDLFQIVLGPGKELGTPMIERADYVMFTGSSATGRSIAEQTGAQLIGFSAELGGKNPLIVRHDALAAKAAAGAVRACFANSGQLCVSIERIYVNAKIWDEFVPLFVKKVEAMKVGSSMEFDVDMGPLISQDQLDKVSEHVDDAVAKGATVLTGGKKLPQAGRFGYAPTVLTDVTPEMKVHGEETFGPVVSLYRVADDDEALALANATEYGLNASVWTGNLREGEKLARQIQSGMVNVNEGYMAAWGSISAPSGGVKNSGMSHRHGAEGIRKYCDIQTVAVQRLLPIDFPEPVMTGFLKVLRWIPPQIGG